MFEFNSQTTNVGPQELYPREKEQNGNRFETIGTAQFSERYRKNAFEIAAQINANFVPDEGPTFDCQRVGRKVKQFHPKNISPNPSLISTFGLDMYNHGPPTITPLSARLKDPHTLNYRQQDTEHKSAMEGDDDVGQEMSAFIQQQLNKDSFIQLGVPIIADD